MKTSIYQQIINKKDKQFKLCSVCFNSLLLSCYYDCLHNKSKHTSACKNCINDRNRKNMLSLSIDDKKKVRDKRNKYVKKYRDNNKDKVNEKSRIYAYNYYQKNRDNKEFLAKKREQSRIYRSKPGIQVKLNQYSRERNYDKMACNNLSNRYIKHSLKLYGNIPESLIELKRNILKIKRKIKQLN